jgi:hypothetical protein
MTEHYNIRPDEKLRPKEREPAAPLTSIFAENIATDRRAYARNWYRAEILGQALVGGNKRLRRLTENLSGVSLVERPYRRPGSDQAASHMLSLSTAGSIDHLFIVAPPYDVEWTDFQPPDAKGTAARGPSVVLATGHMWIDLTETYVDRPVAEGGWMWAGAGVGVWFKPKAPNTYVRVSGLVTYNYMWRDDSNLQVAHNRAQIGKLVSRWLGPGRFETVLDRRDWLWADGTSWYETHEESGDGSWSNQDFFWGSSNEWYLIWFWCNGGIDFATKTTFGSSSAFQSWDVRVPLIVFEQWS